MRFRFPRSNREDTPRRERGAAATSVLFIALAVSYAAHAEKTPDGPTWTFTGMDVIVELHPAEETLRTSGTLTLRCEADGSTELTLFLNNSDVRMCPPMLDAPTPETTTLSGWNGANDSRLVVSYASSTCSGKRAAKSSIPDLSIFLISSSSSSIGPLWEG